MEYLIEFMPWHVWIKMPENKNLGVDDAKKKYDLERDKHMKRQIYFETQKSMKRNLGG